MTRENAINMIIECIYAVVYNEGGLKSGITPKAAISWNYAEIKKIVERYLTTE